MIGLGDREAFEPRAQAGAEDRLELLDEAFGLGEHLLPNGLELGERITGHGSSLASVPR